MIKVEIRDSDVSNIVKSWLKERIELSKCDYGHAEDNEFILELADHCRWILENDFLIKIHEE